MQFRKPKLIAIIFLSIFFALPIFAQEFVYVSSGILDMFLYIQVYVIVKLYYFVQMRFLRLMPDDRSVLDKQKKLPELYKKEVRTISGDLDDS